MPLFGKKKVATGLPIDQTVTMRQQGIPNDQIILNLQNQGYTSSQIFDAMNQIDAGGAGFQQQMPPGPVGPSSEEQMQEQYSQYGGEEAYETGDKERIEEVAEAIIDEKWNDLLKTINRISEWNNKTESRLAKIETEIRNLKDNFDSLHKGILGKITEYDQNLVNVGTEIKAMEKVFQKILPTFTDNVNKLARITEDVKLNNKKK